MSIYLADYTAASHVHLYIFVRGHSLGDIANPKQFKHSAAISEVFTLNILLPHDTTTWFKYLSWRGLTGQASPRTPKVKAIAQVKTSRQTAETLLSRVIYCSFLLHHWREIANDYHFTWTKYANSIDTGIAYFGHLIDKLIHPFKSNLTL